MYDPAGILKPGDIVRVFLNVKRRVTRGKNGGSEYFTTKMVLAASSDVGNEPEVVDGRVAVGREITSVEITTHGSPDAMSRWVAIFYEVVRHCVRRVIELNPDDPKIINDISDEIPLNGERFDQIKCLACSSYREPTQFSESWHWLSSVENNMPGRVADRCLTCMETERGSLSEMLSDDEKLEDFMSVHYSKLRDSKNFAVTGTAKYAHETVATVSSVRSENDLLEAQRHYEQDLLVIKNALRKRQREVVKRAVDKLKNGGRS